MDHESKNIINFFWIGPKVSPLEILCFKSCLKQRMTPVLWCYEIIENIPQGVIVKDANIILSRKKIDYYLHDLKLPIPSVSDIFRYELLYQKGGIYSDTDIIFIKSLDEIEFEEYFCSSFEYNYDECASNCLIKIKKGSIVGKYLVDEANERLNAYINNPEQNIEYCEFGPFVAQKCAKELDVRVLTFDVFNPISWRFAHQLIAYNKFDIKFHVKQLVRFCLPFLYETRGYFITRNTIAIHLCHETWKGNGIDKYSSLNKLSLFERLKSSIQ